MHRDVVVIDLDDADDEQPSRKNKSNPTADVKYFFKAVPASKRSTCLTCQYVPLSHMYYCTD
jgi:hypothetical protein